MANKKTARRALVMSVLSLILCCSMLVGTTFAWFTDEVTSGSNIIKSGTLDAELNYLDATTDKWVDASSITLFDYKYWEPGYTQVQKVQIANVGNLAFRFRLNIIPSVLPAEGDANLADVIDVYLFDAGVTVDRATINAATPVGTLSALMADPTGAAYGVMLPASGSSNVTLNPEDEAIAQTGTVEYTIALKMQESAGNEYQDKSVGEGFRVQLLATQYTYEKDSFDHTYDGGAGYESTPVAVVKKLNVPTQNMLILADPSNFGSGVSTSITPDVAFTFDAADDATTVESNPYKDWLVDYYVSIDRTVNSGLILIGQYDSWSEHWYGFNVPEGSYSDPVGLLGLMSTGGISNWTYEEIVKGVNSFNCGVVDTADMNIGATMTVELRAMNPENTSDYKVISSIKYTFGGNYETLSDGTELFTDADGKTHLFNVANVEASEYAIPASVDTLGNSVFSLNPGITAVTIPASVTDFGATGVSDINASGGAFKGSSVQSVVLSEGMKAIPAAAFNGAKNLTSVTIPASVTTIGVNAFRQTALTELTIPATITNIGYGAFRDMTSLETVTFAGTHVDIPNYAFRGCTKLTSVDLTKVETATIGTNMAFCNASSNNPNTNNITFLTSNESVAKAVKASMGVGSDVAIYVGDTLYAEIK